MVGPVVVALETEVCGGWKEGWKWLVCAALQLSFCRPCHCWFVQGSSEKKDDGRRWLSGRLLVDKIRGCCKLLFSRERRYWRREKEAATGLRERERS